MTESTRVITIKHVSTFVNKVEDLFEITRNFDLIDKCRYVFYGYDGSIISVSTQSTPVDSSCDSVDW